jgi:uncharacterized protein
MSIALIVMAKAPVAGFAKTRLIPALGAVGAAALAQRLLTHTLTQALASRVGPVDLCCAPDAAHPAFRASLAAHTPLGLLRSGQGAGDLGERMHRAFVRHLGHGHGPGAGALMIGTDAPSMTDTVLQAAAAALSTHDAVLVPALDGGYALIGLRQPQPSLFHDMVWSTPQVLQHTRDRLRAAGLHHTELAPMADIDEPQDLAHVPSDWVLGMQDGSRATGATP